MKKLVEHYLKREDELKSQLRQANTPNQVVEIVQDEMKNLTAITDEYLRGLTSRQAQIAATRLRELAQFVNILTAVVRQDSEPIPDAKSSAQSSSEYNSKNLIAVVAISSGSAGIVGSLVAGLLTKKEIIIIPADFHNILRPVCQPYPNIKNNYPDFYQKVKLVCESQQQFNNDVIVPVNPVIAGFVIGGVIAGILAVIFVYQRNRKRRKDKPITNLAPTHKTHLEGVEAIASYLRNKFEFIDSEVAEEANRIEQKPPTPKLEDHLNLLEVLQNLMGEARDEQAQLPKLTKKRIEELSKLLKRDGIEVEFYQPHMKDSSKFDLVPSSDSALKEYITLKPALVKGNKVLLRGRVVKPASFKE